MLHNDYEYRRYINSYYIIHNIIYYKAHAELNGVEHYDQVINHFLYPARSRPITGIIILSPACFKIYFFHRVILYWRFAIDLLPLSLELSLAFIRSEYAPAHDSLIVSIYSITYCQYLRIYMKPIDTMATSVSLAFRRPYIRQYCIVTEDIANSFDLM